MDPVTGLIIGGAFVSNMVIAAMNRAGDQRPAQQQGQGPVRRGSTNSPDTTTTQPTPDNIINGVFDDNDDNQQNSGDGFVTVETAEYSL